MNNPYLGVGLNLESTDNSLASSEVGPMRYANCLFALAAMLPLVCAAAPSPQPSNLVPARPPLVDRDGDGISDGLQAELERARLGDRYRVVVTFKGAGSAAQARAAVGAFELKREFRLIPGFAGTLTAGQIRALAKMPNVFRIEEDFTVYTRLDSARKDFGADAAKASFDATGAGVGVCVVDTGVDPAHEQLNSKSIAFFDATSSATIAYDDHGHGTHVASIAVGDGDGGTNASLYRGVAPAASLHAAKVLAADGTGSDSDVIAGIEWCASQSGVRVISMSLGSGGPSDGLDSLSQAANAAAAGTCTGCSPKSVVVAAGNTGAEPGTVEAPGAAQNVITVAACAEHSMPALNDARSLGVYVAPFSSRGPIFASNGSFKYLKPDVCAPGHSITAAQAGTASGYATYSGTSMATPFVAGAIALALQKKPQLTPAQAKQLVESSAQDRGAGGKDAEWGAGLIDVAALVASAAGAPVPATSFPSALRIEGSVANYGSSEFSFKVADPAVPMAVMVTINGSPKCVFSFFGSCFAFEWSPDLDVELIAPSGSVVATSGCAGQAPAPALPGEDINLGCGIDTNGLYLFARGRHETLRALPSCPASGDCTYRVRVTAANDSSNNGMGGTFALDISNAQGGSTPPPPAPAPTVHIGDLEGSATRTSKNHWSATVTATVHQLTHAPVAGATVIGMWTGFNGTSTCTTNLVGQCSLTRSRISMSLTSVVFTATGVTATGSYQPLDNHDPDGDSNGTAITVMRP
ncbi:S8 family serine peptidase [Piscinibacter sp.]|uniref:S8 family serine peptidase n=1 Tax=Piscinibacter sp. TaxID=1903157 RepID=UPI002F409300